MAATARILHTGMWHLPYKAVNVLCPDGKRRTASTAQESDTWFSLPATVQYNGRTVTGWIGSPTDCSKDLVFHPYLYRRNGFLFPIVTYGMAKDGSTTITAEPNYRALVHAALVTLRAARRNDTLTSAGIYSAYDVVSNAWRHYGNTCRPRLAAHYARMMQPLFDAYHVARNTEYHASIA